MDTTERLHFHFSLSCIGEGNGSPLQCSCLENPRDGGAWWAAVYGVTQSRTRLKRLSSSSSRRKAFPITNKRAHTVAQILLTEIIPRFGLPSSQQFDNGPKFTSKVTQQLVQFLQIPWKFHIPYHPQSSGKVGKMNTIIKETLTIENPAVIYV